MIWELRVGVWKLGVKGYVVKEENFKEKVKVREGEWIGDEESKNLVREGENFGMWRDKIGWERICRENRFKKLYWW